MDHEFEDNDGYSVAYNETEHLIPPCDENNTDGKFKENNPYSDAVPETGHVSTAFPESNFNGKIRGRIVKGDFQIDYELTEPKLEEGDKLLFKHHGSKFDVSLLRSWPESCQFLRVYQCCKLSKDSFTYRSGEKEIFHERKFYHDDFPCKLISEGYVVDKKCNENKNEVVYYEGDGDDDDKALYYGQIDNEGYNRKDGFSFGDQPQGEYSRVVLDECKEEIYRLAEISKDQEFLLLLVWVKENEKENRVVCLSIKEKLEYKEGNEPEYSIRGPVEVDVSEFPSVAQLKLPSANDRYFIYQFANRQIGVQPKVITFPKHLPRRYDKEQFQKKILERHKEVEREKEITIDCFSGFYRIFSRCGSSITDSFSKLFRK